jgi:oxygen-independent coproporphyrinogen III oxidase
MPAQGQRFSLYIHIPYCISKCPYCDFNSHVVPVIPERQYAEALLQELAHYAALEDWRGREVQTVFFGGGTPSTFRPSSIKEILQRIAASFPLASGCEITLEANPGTVDERNFSGYRDSGVNRISVGVQSFQPRLLKFLGRAHSAADARNALAVVREAGFENFSLDLIYANPGQTLAELEADLEIALRYRPPHLSAYNLTFEEGTPFHRDYRSGKLTPLPEEREIAMAELIEMKLSDSGMERYEISNYARPGFPSRHNINYWQGGDYLGLGAGAHSYKRMNDDDARSFRWANEKNPARYMARIEETANAVTETDDVNRARAAGEFMFLGLRMTAGISVQEFRYRFSASPVERYDKISDWLEAELMEEKEGYLRLTPKGLLLANSIFVEFM